MNDNHINDLEISKEVLEKKPKSQYELRKEFFLIARELEKHHSMFYEMWSHGQPSFTTEIPTACMIFAENSFKPIRYVFNPEFWESCSDYKKAWVIAHESMHAMLNHGIRAKNLLHLDQKIVNYAMDLAVNHLLENTFDFERDKVEGWEDYCWVDVMFPDRTDIAKDLSFEEYLIILMEESSKNSGGKSGKPSQEKEQWENIVLVDDHEVLTDEKIAQTINEISQKSIDDAKDIEEKIKSTQGFDSTMSNFTIQEFPTKIQNSKNWEKIVKKWKRKGFIEETEGEPWVKQSRRYTELPEDFCLPVTEDIHDPNFAISRVNVALFMDISGSCEKYVDIFLRACRSIPKKRFIKSAYVFDEQVFEIDIDKYKPVRTDGGTNFKPINAKVEELTANGKKPDLIFVITDAAGPHGNYKEPSKWHWFIINYDVANYYVERIPKQCHIYDLNKFFMYNNSEIE